jgi:hypothetical protein
MTMEEILASPREVNRALMDATTEEDIRRMMIEDGEDPDGPADDTRWRVCYGNSARKGVKSA